MAQRKWAQLVGINAPETILDQLLILPVKLGAEQNVALSQAMTNDQLNTLKKDYFGQFFPLGEADSCPHQ